VLLAGWLAKQILVCVLETEVYEYDLRRPLTWKQYIIDLKRKRILPTALACCDAIQSENGSEKQQMWRRKKALPALLREKEIPPHFVNLLARNLEELPALSC
jgi:hypothetical protein